MDARRPALLCLVFLLVATFGAPFAAARQNEDSPADRIAAAESDLAAAQTRLAATYQRFTAAERRHHTMTRRAEAAREAARRAGEQARAAAARVQRVRQEVDEFAAASYRQGSVVGSVISYLGSDSPTDFLARASMLNALGGRQLDVLQDMRRAVDRKAALDRAARAALGRADADRRAAGEARSAAERAYRAAVRQRDAARRETDELLARKRELQAPRQAEAAGAPAPAPVSASGVVRPTTGRFTSGYGPRGGTIHYGIDIANSIGTPIVSAMAGEVISSGPASGFGLWVRVRHDNGLITVYGHINESLVSVGQRVSAGQRIATMGNRGQSTGPHLHFEVHQGGHKIDPLVWLRSNGVAI
ncbi:murein DD-endopeptidase MepM/ murein hydrolase activator NlpD [Prauserella shujinwangii]|uniref:Murein DD-endopeptidase MepM/ murein hydrolase activator NlpD n=1 Tax=Prauserella shujinwangii TaxID=1453103 RepID=A0A2T0LWC4_9PSEU|nr:M23 family metallopeptidase [Prauserella shujinwangii]PRX48323.1 murein DD-endopeptidase MepM/ murein hydrolase activator NlpD [Prauserella shujinwangii]